MKVQLDRDFVYRYGPERQFEFRAGFVVDGDVAEQAIKAGAAKDPRKKNPRPKVTKPRKPDHEG